MRRWLARLSFSFFIVATFLGIHAYRAAAGEAPPLPPWRVALESVAAVMSLSLGLTGVRERHRPGGP